MAGDWIKMRTNLWDDPRVARLCDLTDQSEAAVIGGLYWLWAMADEHTEDGILPGLTCRAIDRKTGVQGLGAALCEVGWLADHPEGVRIVGFEEHNGASAKKRCQTAKRVAAFKAGNGEETQEQQEGNAPSVTDTLPERDLEKRREEKNSSSLRSEDGAKRKRSPPPPDCPPDVSSQVWEDWLTLRRKKAAPVTATVLESARAESSKAGMSFEAFLTVWCARGSQGLQADWLKPHERPQSHSPPPAETAYQRSMREKVAAICPSIAAKPPNRSETFDVTAKTLGGTDFCEVDADLRPGLSLALGGA